MRAVTFLFVVFTTAVVYGQSPSQRLVDYINAGRESCDVLTVTRSKQLDAVASDYAKQLVKLDRDGLVELDWTFQNLLRPEQATGAAIAAEGYQASAWQEMVVNESEGLIWIYLALLSRYPLPIADNGCDADAMAPDWQDVGVAVAKGQGDQGNGVRGTMAKVVFVFAVRGTQ